MRTLMGGRARTAKKTCVPRILTCLGTAAFAVAAAWLWLATKGVTEALAPQAGPDVAPPTGHADLLPVAGRDPPAGAVLHLDRDRRVLVPGRDRALPPEPAGP